MSLTIFLGGSRLLAIGFQLIGLRECKMGEEEYKRM